MRLIIPSVIGGLATLIVTLINWSLTERLRTEISKQSLVISEQSLELERVKVQVSQAGQRLAEAGLALQTKNSNTDEVRLTVDFVKLTNDLVPKITMDCSARKIESNQVLIGCVMVNGGANRTKITATSIVAAEPYSKKVIPSYIASWTGKGVMSLPSGTRGHRELLVEIAPGQSLGVDKVMFGIMFQEETHAAAVNLTRRLSKGVISDDELKDFSTQAQLYYTHLPNVTFANPSTP